MVAPDDDRAVKHAMLVSKIRSNLVAQVEKTRKNAFDARQDTIHKRTESIEKVRTSLLETTKLIQARHEAISNKINQDAIHREVNIRVNRGLEALERFIQVLRESDLDADMLEKAIHDPIISKSIKSEARKIFASDFFRSVQSQLVMQTEFINIAAHELRTPIMPILVNIELLEQDFGKDNEEIKIIARNARRLQRLTENILSVTKIESGSLKLNKESFDVNSVISDVIKEETTRLENKKIRLVHHTKLDSIYVYADKDRILQVIYNLINNAMKFTKEGDITITSEVVDNELIVSVQDRGAGIDHDILPLLFLKFSTKSNKGTGLGLYISKSIVESHDGRIWAKNNTDGPGAAVGFSLPLEKPT
ncbi:MAG: HAMP domain-containing histidine kinase [Candidatus Nitrosotenuis sp.]|nr:MAG: HAMP domain-containing histidine kinase [Candidatus Nitrosotenuis sp.]